MLMSFTLPINIITNCAKSLLYLDVTISDRIAIYNHYHISQLQFTIRVTITTRNDKLASEIANYKLDNYN